MKHPHSLQDTQLNKLLKHIKILYGVLADDQTAATTTANLQALGLSQEELTRLTYGTIGAWTKYGDSIPIDGVSRSS